MIEQLSKVIDLEKDQLETFLKKDKEIEKLKKDINEKDKETEKLKKDFREKIEILENEKDREIEQLKNVQKMKKKKNNY